MSGQEFGFFIKQISDRFRCDLNLRLKRYDLTTAQLNVLLYMQSCTHDVTQKDIAAHFALKHPTVAGIVRRLAQKGFICCRQDSADKRRTVLTLTDRAREMRAFLDSSKQRVNALLTEGLTPEELAVTQRVLQKMLHNLDRLDERAAVPGKTAEGREDARR